MLLWVSFTRVSFVYMCVYVGLCTKELGLAQRDGLVFALSFWKVIRAVLDRRGFVQGFDLPEGSATWLRMGASGHTALVTLGPKFQCWLHVSVVQVLNSSEYCVRCILFLSLSESVIGLPFTLESCPLASFPEDQTLLTRQKRAPRARLSKSHCTLLPGDEACHSLTNLGLLLTARQAPRLPSLLST